MAALQKAHALLQQENDQQKKDYVKLQEEKVRTEKALRDAMEEGRVEHQGQQPAVRGAEAADADEAVAEDVPQLALLRARGGRSEMLRGRWGGGSMSGTPVGGAARPRSTCPGRQAAARRAG